MTLMTWLELSSSTVVESSIASGLSLTGLASMVTVPVADPPNPSEAVYWKLSLPKKLALGT